MGTNFSTVFTPIFEQKEVSVLMLGFDGSGKTTILYQLQLGKDIKPVPTIGFNVETVFTNDLKMTFWDVGGHPKIRPLWRHYYAATSVLIFVVDSNDKDRIS